MYSCAVRGILRLQRIQQVVVEDDVAVGRADPRVRDFAVRKVETPGEGGDGADAGGAGQLADFGRHETGGVAGVAGRGEGPVFEFAGAFQFVRRPAPSSCPR